MSKWLDWHFYLTSTWHLPCMLQQKDCIRLRDISMQHVKLRGEYRFPLHTLSEGSIDSIICSSKASVFLRLHWYNWCEGGLDQNDSYPLQTVHVNLTNRLSKDFPKLLLVQLEQVTNTVLAPTQLFVILRFTSTLWTCPPKSGFLAQNHQNPELGCIFSKRTANRALLVYESHSSKKDFIKNN